MKEPTAEDIEKFAKRIESLLGESYKVEANKEIINLFGLIKDTFDLVVYENSQPLVAIEYKSVFYGIAYKIHKDWFYNRIHKLGIPYAILYYEKEEEVYFYSKTKNEIQFLSLKDAIKAISTKTACGEQPNADELYTEISFPEVDSDSIEFDEDFRISQFVNSIVKDENLQYDNSLGIISFTPGAEDTFFRGLLPQENDVLVCRYTTIDSLFLSFQNTNHCMISITCMNDKGELTYADKLAGNFVYSDSDENVAHNNNCFILSCCKMQKADDLTMWRLYGDNAQGCCVKYELDTNIVDNKKFFFAPVSYGDSSNHHLQLEYVEAFLKLNYKGWTFRFNRWHIWKHFFKSHLFKDENEYRLLYIAGDNESENIEWIRDNTNHIVSRIKTFDCKSESFPLTVKEVIIGPKCPEKETMVTQFRYMNQHQKIINQIVHNAIRPSEIKDYR